MFHHRTFAALAVVSTLAASSAAPEDASEHVGQTLEDFARGAADRDEDLLRRALHPSSRQYVPTPQGIQELDLETYLGLIRSGKIGGSPLRVELLEIRVDGDVAAAEAVFHGDSLDLKHTLSLVRDGERWRVLSTVVRIVPNDA